MSKRTTLVAPRRTFDRDDGDADRGAAARPGRGRGAGRAYHKRWHRQY